jgi:hypothetical protein
MSDALRRLINLCLADAARQYAERVDAEMTGAAKGAQRMSDLDELIDLLREAHEQQRTAFKDAPTLYSRAADALERFRWVPVSERLPEAGELVMVYSPPTKDSWPDEMNVGFDCIDPDVDDPGPYAWLNHNNHYEHYCAVACEGMTGPREQAPYTHWMPLPPAPEPD